MADIFISYARSTASQAQQIAEALRALGYGVWRDDELPAHRSYAEVIEERLKAAKAVVVIWSAEGVKSEWVQSEADRARNDRKLVQLTVDGTALPMPFDRIQCADLSGWSGDLTALGWRKVVASIADLIGGTAPTSAPSPSSGRTGVSICVLPFANMSNDADQEYFADGISEDIITDLSKVSALLVIARNTAFTFKGKSVDVKHVARQLEVSHVLEGSVRKSGSRVRITAQLIDGASGGHIWAERYDRDVSDIFALQDEISQAVVSALKLKLFPEEKRAIEDRGTTNVAAYDIALRARALMNQHGGANLMRAAELFREAIALDPAYLPAHEGLVSALSDYALYVPKERAAVVLKEVEVVQEHMISIAPSASLALELEANMRARNRDYLGAEKLLEKLPPGSKAPYARVRIDLSVGRITEALQAYRTMARQDPLSLLISTLLQDILDMVGLAEEAEIEYERSRDLPGDRELVETSAFMRLYRHASRETINARFRQRILPQAQPGLRPMLERLEPVLFDPPAALAVVEDSGETRRQSGGPRYGLQEACLFGCFGDKERVLAALRSVYVDGKTNVLRILWLPQLAEARKDPRFKEIAREIGLYDYWRQTGHWGDFARPVGDGDFEIIR